MNRDLEVIITSDELKVKAEAAGEEMKESAAVATLEAKLDE